MKDMYPSNLLHVPDFISEIFQGTRVFSPSPMNPNYFTEFCFALCFPLMLKLLQGITSVEYTAIKDYNFILNILFKPPNHPMRWALYISD